MHCRGFAWQVLETSCHGLVIERSEVGWANATKNPPDASCVSRVQNNTVAGKWKPAKALRWNLYAAGWGNPDTADGDYAKEKCPPHSL